MSEPTVSVRITKDQAGEILAALHERAAETSRYIGSTARLIDSHAGHGDHCCAAGPSLWVEQLEALHKRAGDIRSAIELIEALEVKP